MGVGVMGDDASERGRNGLLLMSKDDPWCAGGGVGKLVGIGRDGYNLCAGGVSGEYGGIVVLDGWKNMRENGAATG